jgi:hypothetical protein
MQATCIIGYSVALYFIPTVLCMFTSIAWYVTLLFGQAIIRSIFLFRNFSTRIESRTYVLLMVFLLVEFFYSYVLLQVVFFKYSGYTFTEGINQLTASSTSLTQPELKVPPSDYQPGILPGASEAVADVPAVVAVAHMMLLRHFVG